LAPQFKASDTSIYVLVRDVPKEVRAVMVAVETKATIKP
jgi:hypothetical protein